MTTLSASQTLRRRLKETVPVKAAPPRLGGAVGSLLGTTVGFRSYKVSPSGQLTLSPTIRRGLQVKPLGYVDVLQLAAGVIVRRPFDQGGYAARSPIRRPLGLPVPSRHKVSSIGQFSIPAKTRRTWGIEDGGYVAVASVRDTVVILPLGGSAALLREWSGITQCANTRVTRIHRVSKGGGHEDHSTLRGDMRALVDGSLLEGLVCDLPIPGAEHVSAFDVAWPQYAYFASRLTRTLLDRELPLPMKSLEEAGGGRIDRYQWVVLMLDPKREFLQGKSMTLVTPRDAVAAEAAVLAHRWQIDEWMAVNLVMARDEGTPLYAKADSVDDGVQRALSDLGLTQGGPRHG